MAGSYRRLGRCFKEGPRIWCGPAREGTGGSSPQDSRLQFGGGGPDNNNTNANANANANSGSGLDGPSDSTSAGRD